MLGSRSLGPLSLGTLLLYFCASLDPLCAQTNETVKEGSNSIRGTVLNKVTHEPIARALVFSQDNHFATLTDDRGNFAFAVPQVQPAAGVEVQAFMPGRNLFLMARKPGFLVDKENYEQQMSQVSGTDQAVTILLEPESLVVGQVLMPASGGSDRIQVELFRRQVREGREHWDSAGTVTTKSDGGFRFAELSPGSYKLATHELLDRDPLTFNPSGQLYGYPPVYYPPVADSATDSMIRLSAGNTVRVNLSPERRAYYPVKMRVANMPADLSMGISVWPIGGQAPGYSLGYNLEEQLIQGALPDGTYLVRATTYGPNGTGTTGESTLTVKGSAAEGAILTLLPNSSIPVRVEEEFQHTEIPTQGLVSVDGNLSNSGRGRRPNYLNVSLIPIEDFGSRSGGFLRPPKGPDDDPPLVIENVQPGRYRVSVHTNIGFVSSITSGSTNLLRQPLVVGEGGVPAPIEITVRDDGAEVEGTIERTTTKGRDKAPLETPAKPLGNVYFIPKDDETSQFRTAWVSPDEKFQLQQLPPGTYRVLAFGREQPNLEYANEEALSKYESKSQVIQVVSGQKVRLQLPLITEGE